MKSLTAEKANSLPQVGQLIKEESHLSPGIRAPQSILVDLVLCWVRHSICSQGLQSLKGQMCRRMCPYSVRTACRKCGERINSNFSKGSQLANSRTRIRFESSEFELQSQCVLHLIGQACIWCVFRTTLRNNALRGTQPVNQRIKAGPLWIGKAKHCGSYQI